MPTMVNRSETSGAGRRQRLSQADVPGHTLPDALRVAQVIKDEYAMQPATPIAVAQALGVKPTSGGFRSITGAAVAYGLTTGAYNSSEIGLTDLGRRAVAPTEEGDDLIAQREAFQKPRVINDFVGKYRGFKFPRESIAKNVLIEMGVPVEAAERVRMLIREGASRLGLLTEIKGDYFFDTQPGARALAPEDPLPTEGAAGEEPPGEDSTLDDAPNHPPIEQPAVARPSAIFIGHGKNKKPKDELVKMLVEWGIPHREAIDEPNAGRPIPHKVAETMRECGAAILVFTADEELQTSDGESIWRPSENVAHELGAAGVLYDNRIIILKEDRVTLASNFNSIGYIEFEQDRLADKVLELLRELRHFGILNMTVAAGG
jgi:hypothetical protein